MIGGFYNRKIGLTHWIERTMGNQGGWSGLKRANTQKSPWTFLTRFKRWSIILVSSLSTGTAYHPHHVVLFLWYFYENKRHKLFQVALHFYSFPYNILLHKETSVESFRISLFNPLNLSSLSQWWSDTKSYNNYSFPQSSALFYVVGFGRTTIE